MPGEPAVNFLWNPSARPIGHLTTSTVRVKETRSAARGHRDVERGKRRLLVNCEDSLRIQIDLLHFPKAPVSSNHKKSGQRRISGIPTSSYPMSARLRNPEETRQRIVRAAMTLILRKGYNATTVDEICAASGLTKGSFFHHFPNKDALGQAAIEAWGTLGTALYAAAWEDASADPLDQIHRFFDIMSGFTEDEAVCTCVVGIMSQELAQSHPALRAACRTELERWTDNTTRMLAAAKEKHAPHADFDPKDIAWFLNSVWQGSMLVGKTCGTPQMIRHNLRLARACVDALFSDPMPT